MQVDPKGWLPAAAPTAELGHGVIDADRRLAEHQAPQSSLVWFRIGLMGLGGQMGAHQGYVGGMDEVEAGFGAQPLSKPQPAGCLPNPGGEIAGGMAVARTHLTPKYQGGKYGHNFGG